MVQGGQGNAVLSEDYLHCLDALQDLQLKALLHESALSLHGNLTR